MTFTEWLMYFAAALMGAGLLILVLPVMMWLTYRDEIPGDAPLPIPRGKQSRRTDCGHSEMDRREWQAEDY